MTTSVRVGLGARQRKMLRDMKVFGNGRWPQGWHMSYDETTSVLPSLVKRGLVEGEGYEVGLTESGRIIAEWMYGDPPGGGGR